MRVGRRGRGLRAEGGVGVETPWSGERADHRLIRWLSSWEKRHADLERARVKNLEFRMGRLCGEITNGLES